MLTLAWVLHAAAAPPANAPTSRSGPCSLDQQPFPLPPPWRPCLPPTTQPGSTRLYFPGLWGFWENIFPKRQEREQETRPSVAHPPWGFVCEDTRLPELLSLSRDQKGLPEQRHRTNQQTRERTLSPGRNQLCFGFANHWTSCQRKLQPTAYATPGRFVVLIVAFRNIPAGVGD